MLTDSDFEQIKSGDSVLLLGAGATIGSTRFGDASKPVLGAYDLATKIAQNINEPYDDEPLRDVYDAARELRNQEWINTLLKCVLPAPNEQIVKGA